MCLISFALDQHPDFPLVVAANRDEFFRRPTAPMDWWRTESGQEVLAGRDLQSGGTWLAVARNGAVSAVTNVREGTQQAGRLSRGRLPLLALQSPDSTLKKLLPREADAYSGFNLLYLEGTSGWYYSNRDAHPGRHVHRGLYGLSNHLLQTPWPKLVRLRHSLGEILECTRSDEQQLHLDLIAAMQDTRPAPDQQLPDTGVGLETERFLSSPFVFGAEYGTRASTIVTLSASGQIRVSEQSWGPCAQRLESRTFHWQLETSGSDIIRKITTPDRRSPDGR